jgi:hypothetical protein
MMSSSPIDTISIGKTDKERLRERHGDAESQMYWPE